MSNMKRSRPDESLRRLSRAVIQLAQAQAEVEAEAAHRQHQVEGKVRKPSSATRRGGKEDAA